MPSALTSLTEPSAFGTTAMTEAGPTGFGGGGYGVGVANIAAGVTGFGPGLGAG